MKNIEKDNSKAFKTPELITLSSDFGHKNWFVASMKCVISQISPKARLMDFSHGLAPFSIVNGCLYLEALYPHLPYGVHVCVVDPGVGSARKPLLMAFSRGYFIGPDNGLLSSLYKQELETSQKPQVVQIENPKFMLKDPSSTFHGRDIFAPAAAHLTQGVPFQEFGPEITPKLLTLPQATTKERNIVGEVLVADHYGNIITNIHQKLLDAQEKYRIDSVSIGEHLISAPVHFYQQGSTSGLNSIINSIGHLEIFIRKGSAQKKFQLKAGMKVTVHLS